MRLKTLDLHGFKSFPDRIQLQFDDGITAVVGPNGSGKSNISDAVRWVLGEQSGKTLRSGKMEDVIFSGTQQRKGMGFASVSLTIDNADRNLDINSDEVVINRKIYRSGDSEYRINGASVRLRDITELFMDTGLGRDGYSIIGQGKIAEIVSAKSAQRREIFEEAAGISKYRYRREQAERRLGAAEENLLRLKDIMSELEVRVEPLREQSEKALEYLELAERRRTLEISLWIETVEHSREQLRQQDDKLTLSRNEHDEINEQLDSIEAAIQGYYDEIAACNMGLEGVRSKTEEANAKISEETSKIAVLNNDISHNEDTMERLRGDIEAHSGNKESIGESIRRSGEQVAAKRAELLELEAGVGGIKDELLELESKNSEGLKQQNALMQERAELTHQIATERLKMASSSTMLEQLSESAKDIDSQREGQENSLLDLDSQLKNYTELCESIDDNLISQQNIKKGYLIKHKSLGDRQLELNAQLSDITSKQKGYLQKAKLIEDMERNMEGFVHSVKYIMKEAKNGALRGIEGPVSQLIKVPAKYATAIEVALAGAMQNIVVVSEAAAKVAIEKLKSQNAGRATFLPISVIKPRVLGEKGLESREGFVSVAEELVTCEPKYRDIVKNLLGKIVVAEDLDSAVLIAKDYGYRFRVVTLDGQVVNPGGSLTGGSLSGSSGILSRAGEIESLRDKAQKAQERIDELNLLAKASGEELSLLQSQLLGIDSEIKNMSEDRIRYEGEQKRVSMAKDELVREISERERRREEIARRLTGLYKESGSSEEIIKKMTAVEDEISVKLELIAGELQGSAIKLSELSEKKNAVELNRVSLLKDIEAIESLSTQLSQQMQQQQGQTDELTARIAELTDKNLEIEGQILKAEGIITELRDRVKGFSESTAEFSARKLMLEQKSSTERQRERELHQRMETAARELARLEERKVAIQLEYDSVISRLYDEYELTLTEAQGLATKIPDQQAATRELGGIKNKIKALGNINVAAIDEYKEVKERYEFMRTQLNDIETSKEELHKLISELTADMRDIFVKSFNDINRHFGTIFSELFSGGSGKLLLTEPDNVLESGIEIYVQPPGKIIKNLAALSGGEQAFVAIAIYFAILKVRPSPFCLLDEIEAALDDVNVVKYSSYLRRLTGKTQFIAITHRRGTMEEADVLYGVTMQEEGISKLLKLEVSELESKLGMK